MVYRNFLVTYIFFILIGINFAKNFIPFGRYEYYFGDDKFTGNFEESELECLKNNATLVIIYTEEINEFLRNNTSDSFYIGLLRVEDGNTNSSFRWIDGSNLESTILNWGQGEPNNFGFFREEGCVEVVSDSFTWNDVSCNNDRRHVCQRKIRSCNTSNPCGKNSYCDDSTGNIRCICNRGYEGDGFFNCTDIVQVQSCTSNTCGENSYCDDSTGNIRCICNRGYEGDGFVNCTDIDECEMLPNTTCADCMCKNTPGSFFYTNMQRESTTETDIRTESGLDHTAARIYDCRDRVNDTDCWIIVVLSIVGLIIAELIVGVVLYKISKNRKKPKLGNTEERTHNSNQQDDYTELNIYQVATEPSTNRNAENQAENMTYDSLNR